MTDLPRFFEGEFGKLDFTTMNEMMKRLDLLLPLAQAAASGGGWKAGERSLVFPVYAERKGEPDDEGFYKYDWWEITVVEDQMAWAGENTTDEGDTQLRAGSNALLPFNPRDSEPNTDAFIDGFAIAFAIRSANTDAATGGIRYVLFPLAIPTDPGVGYVRIEGDPSPATIQIGDETRGVLEYPATFLQPEPGPEGEAGLAVMNEDAIAIDLNANAINEPSVEGSDATLTPRAYDVGTMFQATKVGEDRYAFTHLIRFDVTCT